MKAHIKNRPPILVKDENVAVPRPLNTSILHGFSMFLKPIHIWLAFFLPYLPSKTTILFLIFLNNITAFCSWSIVGDWINQSILLLVNPIGQIGIVFSIFPFHIYVVIQSWDSRIRNFEKNSIIFQAMNGRCIVIVKNEFRTNYDFAHEHKIMVISGGSRIKSSWGLIDENS